MLRWSVGVVVLCLAIVGSFGWFIYSHPLKQPAVIRVVPVPTVLLPTPITPLNPPAATDPQAPPAPPSPPTLSIGSTGTAVLALEQALATLHYLPLTFATTVSKQAEEARWTAFQSTTGDFSWRFANVPYPLQSLWQASRYTVVVQGAVMALETHDNLTIDGAAGPQVWRAILRDVAANRINAGAYTYVMVKKNAPEQLQLWSNGAVVYTSLANTGIAAAPTPNGTWPVYLRYASQTMEGTSPSGEHYSDAGVPWVSYFYGGDAIHGFTRAAYGYPQSLGCVELPPERAAVVFHDIDYGTLVTVE